MSDIVADIKARLSIEDIVAQYVHLKPSGRNLKGLCPFHQEKTPSFMVSPEKQIAYCFGCHKGGDIINFIEEVEGVEFKDAITILADKAGIDMAQYQFSEPKHSTSEKSVLYELHAAAASFYEDTLWNTEKGEKVLTYLRNRGLNDDTIQKFHFGLAPDSFDKTHLYLVKQGYSREHIVLSGMAISKNTQADSVYDRFRARLMIPIYDNVGRMVGFGGRALKKDDQPKYLNSPDSPIYRKSDILYGYNLGKDAIKKEDAVILVEGYFDVIMSHQAGVVNVAATSGTALTPQQIKLIKRFTKNMIFSFDTDKAGIEAAKRGFELAQHEEMNVRVLHDMAAKDPADFIKENPDQWIEIVNQSIPFMQFCIDEVVRSHDDGSLQGKKKMLAELHPFFQILSSSFEKDYFVRELAQKLDIKEVVIYDELKKKKAMHTYTQSENQKQPDVSTKKIRSLDLLLTLIIEYPSLLEKEFKAIPEKMLEENEKGIYNAIKDNYNLLRAEGKRKEFLTYLNDEIQQRIEMISLFVDEVYGTYNEHMIREEAQKLLEKNVKRLLNNQKKNLSSKIREAEKNGDASMAKELLIKLQKLMSS